MPRLGALFPFPPGVHHPGPLGWAPFWLLSGGARGGRAGVLISQDSSKSEGDTFLKGKKKMLLLKSERKKISIMHVVAPGPTFPVRGFGAPPQKPPQGEGGEGVDVPRLKRLVALAGGSRRRGPILLDPHPVRALVRARVLGRRGQSSAQCPGPRRGD